MEFKIDIETIKPYFQGKKKHKNYYKALDEYYHMDFHFNGFFVPPVVGREGKLPEITFDNKPMVGNPYFDRLITQRRPSESDQISAYRKTIYLPESKSPCFKVYNSLRKIVKSPDWKIDYSKSERPPGIADGEYLEDYCEYKYPEFTSVENWFYTYGMKNMLIDSNALIFVLPKNFEIEKNEYYEPIATVINCEHVYGYKENEYAIFDVDRDYEFQSGNLTRKGKCLGIITKEGYWEARQVSDKGQFELIEVMAFTMEYMPAWLIGGVVKKYNRDYTLYNSFMSPMLPGLDGMAMAISDEDAEWVQHVYSTMWYYSAQDCNHCQGKGKVKGKGNQLVVCTECMGQGNAPKSPYRDMVLKTGTFDNQTMPTPPAGYIQKQTDIAKLFVERIDKKEWRALASINHEFLSESPAVQSGISKAYDRQELENYTYSVAYHSIVNVLDNIYYFINEFRYMEAVPNEIMRKKMLPRIDVPIRYDLITSSVLEMQMKSAMDAKADPEIIDEIELEYIAKNFPNNPELRDKLKLKKSLDPFPRLSIDDKNNMLLNKSVELIDVIVSNYLHPFIEMALFEYEDFCHWDLDKQKEKIYEYAQEKVDKLDSSQKIKDKATMDKLKTNPIVPNIPM